MQQPPMMKQPSNSDETSSPVLHGFFFPLPSPGHMIPLIDIAKLVSRRGVSATIVTTPGNESLALPTIHRFNSSSSARPINLILLPFPPSCAALIHSENLTNLPPSDFSHLLAAVASLRPSLQHLLRRQSADFLVSDATHIWTADMAAELGIPHIVFSGHGAFPLCVHQSLALLNPHERADHTCPIRLPDLPNPIELTKPEISQIFDFPAMVRMMKEAEEKSFGVVVNSFYELEPAYADLFRREGRRAWFVGPVSLADDDDDDDDHQIGRADRGKIMHPDTDRLMRWLDHQPARSVVYACFGSLCRFDAAQMREIAIGLEKSGRRFVWAVRDWQGAADSAAAEWLPEGFEGRVEGKGWVVRGWAPQVVILGHVAVGGFVTHCGWNSTVEGVAAGLPMVAWPLMYEQFVNERLITEVLGVGVRVRKGAGVRVTAEEAAAAVGRVMGDGDEAEGFRRRAKRFGELAKGAVEIGGSSYEDVGRMLEDLNKALKKLGE